MLIGSIFLSMIEELFPPIPKCIFVNNSFSERDEVVRVIHETIEIANMRTNFMLVKVTDAVVEQVIRNNSEAFSAQPLVQFHVSPTVIANAMKTHDYSAHWHLFCWKKRKVKKSLLSSI